MTRGLTLLFAACLLLSVRGVRAFPGQHGGVGETIEWIVADSALVVRGRIVSAERFVPPEPVPGLEPDWQRVTVQVTRTLKGPPPGRTVTFIARRLPFASRANIGDDWVARGTDAVFCLIPHAAAVAQVDDSRFPVPRAPRVLRQTEPGPNGATAAYTMNAPAREPVPTLDLTLEGDPERLLSAIARAAEASAGETMARRLAFFLHPPPPGIDADLVALLERYPLVIPLNSLTEQAARRWAVRTDWEMRSAALHALEHFDNPQNRPLVREMLTDPYGEVYDEWATNLWTIRHYALRSRARDILDTWGEPHGPVVEKDLDWQAVPRGVWLWHVVGIAALVALAGGVAWRRGGPAAAARAALRFTCRSVMLLVAAACLAAFAGTRGRSAELVVPQRNGLFRGGLASDGLWFHAFDASWIEFIEGSTGFAPPVVASWAAYAPRDDLRPRLSASAVEWAGKPLEAGGVLLGTGAVPADFKRPLPVRVARIPWWVLLALSCAGPGLSAVLVARRRFIVALRRRAGRCVRCGYDLRGNPGAPCPECGAAGAAAR